jgi:large subunit ribosomal protein L18
MNKKKILRKQKRVRSKFSDRLRLSVFKSNRYISAQIIDDKKGETLLSVSERELKEKLPRVEKAKKVGALLAEKAKKIKISEVVFDRGRFMYHGRVKALAEGAREGGLKF